MILLRLIGWLLILAALYLLGREAFAWLDGDGWTVVSAGELWTDLDSNSLAAAENSARDLSPKVRHGFDTVMGWPSWALIGGIGLLLSLARTRRRRGNGRGRRIFRS